MADDVRQLEPESPGYIRILGAIHGRPWAIREAELEAIIAIVNAPAADLEAVAARLGKPLDNANGNRVENRDGVAVLHVEGPIFRYGNIMTRVSGATSVQQLSLDFQAALDDPKIGSVLLNINSPGGQVDGINEMASLIRKGNAVKPVTAYGGAMVASGAYWLAAAASKIVVNESAQLGSIGVLASITDNRGAQERQGVKRYDIVSSQSPNKMNDPATDAGRARIQQQVDDIAQLFIDKVAAYRGVTAAKVATDFGQGDVLLAPKAVAAGMADAVGSYEELLGAMKAQARSPMVPAPQAPGSQSEGSTVPVPVPGQGAGSTAAAAPMDEQELEEDTDEAAELNEHSDCTCPPGTDPEDCHCGEDDEDESEGSDNPNEEQQEENAMATTTEERQRIAAILNSEEARGREDLARVLALETNHTPEEAKRILLASPLAHKPNALETRMAAINNPKVGVPGDEQTDDSPQAEAARILRFVPKDWKKTAVQ
jgi:capsid assembly protease